MLRIVKDLKMRIMTRGFLLHFLSVTAATAICHCVGHLVDLEIGVVMRTNTGEGWCLLLSIVALGRV